MDQIEISWLPTQLTYHEHENWIWSDWLNRNEANDDRNWFLVSFSATPRDTRELSLMNFDCSELAPNVE